MMVSRFELVCEGGNDSTCNERGMNVCIRVVCGGVLFGSIGQYSVHS